MMIPFNKLSREGFSSTAGHSQYNTKSVSEKENHNTKAT